MKSMFFEPDRYFRGGRGVNGIKESILNQAVEALFEVRLVGIEEEKYMRVK